MPCPTSAESVRGRSPAWLALGLLLTLSAAGGCEAAGDARAAEARAQQAQAGGAATAETPLPNREGSLKFGVLGDFGTGSRTQYELGEQMAALHDRFKYQLVVLTGDNLYGSERPQDFVRKFEKPYKALLDRNV